MKVKTKILWTLLGMSVLVALDGALAVNRLQAAAMANVTREAQDAARLRSYLLMSDPNKLSTSAQEMVAKLHQTQGRDLEVVDPSQLVLAAAISSHIGKRFTGSPGDEVGAIV
jgi:hypothetical protein